MTTAKELRDLLADVPDDTPIITDGYELYLDPVDTTCKYRVGPYGGWEPGSMLGRLAPAEDVERWADTFDAFYIGTGRGL